MTDDKKYKVKVLMTEFVTHNVKRFIVEKPANYIFIPGQATDVTIDEDGFNEMKNPFTFTCNNSDSVLEFTIKEYPKHSGVTEKLHKIASGSTIIIRKPFGKIHYIEKGTFIAGGAGITPFLAIFRELYENNKLQGNKLIYSNKTADDIIVEKELRYYFRQDVIFTVTDENNDRYHNEKIDDNFLSENIKDLDQHFYICGPDKMVSDIYRSLIHFKVNKSNITTEGGIIK